MRKIVEEMSIGRYLTDTFQFLIVPIGTDTWAHPYQKLWENQVVKYVNIGQYIGEFEMVILSSHIVVGEFYLIFPPAMIAILLIRRDSHDFGGKFSSI